MNIFLWVDHFPEGTIFCLRKFGALYAYSFKSKWVSASWNRNIFSCSDMFHAVPHFLCNLKGDKSSQRRDAAHDRDFNSVQMKFQSCYLKIQRRILLFFHSMSIFPLLRCFQNALHCESCPVQYLNCSLKMKYPMTLMNEGNWGCYPCGTSKTHYFFCHLMKTNHWSSFYLPLVLRDYIYTYCHHSPKPFNSLMLSLLFENILLVAVFNLHCGSHSFSCI